ncbi:putative capsid protein [Paramuricea placomus associated circular virus]|uniref:putative capsid protein n=1 Tax=Paramuricea placomus associated circular virus TaxID=1692260 RepID=UPI0006A6E115|nr:putative capsid protein [Paramuricea placomus associated circular virus]AKV62297.1 putative capsid protein [Paramuricea placomus associated circular virus]
MAYVRKRSFRKRTSWKKMTRGFRKKKPAKANLNWRKRRSQSFRRARRTRRAANPGTAIVTSSTFEMNFAGTSPILGILNGTNLAEMGGVASCLVRELYIQPGRIAGLLARQFVYNMYKIYSVEYKLIRSDKSRISSGPISADYAYADFAMLMPNTHNEDFPGISTAGSIQTTRKLMNWMLQQKGSKMVKLQQNFAKMKVPAMVNVEREFQQNTGTGTVTQMSTIPHPWIEIDTDKMNTMNIGQVIFAMPALNISTFYPVFPTPEAQTAAGTGDVGAPGQTYDNLKKMYDYSIFATVRWGVKGKYIDPAVAQEYHQPSQVGDDEPEEFGEDTVDMGSLIDNMQNMTIA